MNSMNDELALLAENDTDTLSKTHIEDRVSDWQDRLGRLLTRIEAWGTSHGWKVEDRTAVESHEELMKRFGVGPISLPSLRLTQDERVIWVQPKALWVIGANGRVDVFTTKGSFVLVDLAAYGSPANWTLFGTKRGHPEASFEPELLADLA